MDHESPLAAMASIRSLITHTGLHACGLQALLTARNASRSVNAARSPPGGVAVPRILPGPCIGCAHYTGLSMATCARPSSTIPNWHAALELQMYLRISRRGQSSYGRWGKTAASVPLRDRGGACLTVHIISSPAAVHGQTVCLPQPPRARARTHIHTPTDTQTQLHRRLPLRRTPTTPPCVYD